MRLLATLNERLFLGQAQYYRFRVWYRNALSDYGRVMLLNSRILSRPCLQASAVVVIVRHYLEGGRNYNTAIHTILTLEHSHRLFLN